MKKTIIAICCVLALVLSVTIAQAITMLDFGDEYYVGQIVDGIPPSNEPAFMNVLTSLNANQIPVALDDEGNTPDVGEPYEIYNRIGSSLPDILPEVPSVYEGQNEDPGFEKTVVTGTPTYFLGKYNQAKAGSFVWLLNEAGKFQLPSKDPIEDKYGLSHSSVWRSVPEPGTCFLILGLVLVCLPAIKRNSV